LVAAAKEGGREINPNTVPGPNGGVADSLDEAKAASQTNASVAYPTLAEKIKMFEDSTLG
jgi:hypothetical protein